MMEIQASTRLPWYLRSLIASVAVIHAIGFGMVLATATDWGRAYGLGIGAVIVFFTSALACLLAATLWLRSRTKANGSAAPSPKRTPPGGR